MNSISSHARILIVEHRSTELVALTIWLSQFAELLISSNLSANNLIVGTENKIVTEYDLIIFGMEMVSSHEVPFRLIADFSRLCKLKSMLEIPILLLLSGYPSSMKTNNTGEQIYAQIFNECDSILSTNHSLGSIYTEITRLLACKQQAKSPIKKLVAVAR